MRIALLVVAPLLLAGAPTLDTSIPVREPPRADAGAAPDGDRVQMVMLVREVLPDGGVSPLPKWMLEPRPPGSGLWGR